MTIAHRFESVIESDGSLSARNLPFQPGDRVEVIILAKDSNGASRPRYPLHGSAYRFDDPFTPVVDPDEWEVNR